ncbi:MAG: metallophosphoesterase, partial [Gammaproteobacteria bacterium]|nr:metallophosphoesterase [Gammaproteobacteria bacterium]
MDKDIYSALEARLGHVHLQQRLGIETDYEARVFGQGINFFHIENWYSIHHVIRGALSCLGLHGRGMRNALQLRVTSNELVLRSLPSAFDGFRILHITDLHLDMNAQIPHALIECVCDIDYDVCVLTGDFRGKTYGPYDAVIEAMQRVRVHLKGPVFGILGNHDSIRMVPGFEAAGVRML